MSMKGNRLVRTLGKVMCIEVAGHYMYENFGIVFLLQDKVPRGQCWSRGVANHSSCTLSNGVHRCTSYSFLAEQHAYALRTVWH